MELYLLEDFKLCYIDYFEDLRLNILYSKKYHKYVIVNTINDILYSIVFKSGKIVYIDDDLFSNNFFNPSLEKLEFFLNNELLNQKEIEMNFV